MIGGNFAANHDRVYIYDPTINPSGLQLMPNRLKVGKYLTPIDKYARTNFDL